MSTRWTAENIPDQSGKVIVVTGANSGIGFEATRELARRGAHVVLACRNMNNAAEAVSALEAEARAEGRKAHVEALPLDLANLSSVRTFARELEARHPRIDVLCNNAGVMALPRRETKDGFEMQFGTNHLGHFALTGLLLDALARADAARIVTVSSGAHYFGEIDFDDLQGQKRYRKWRAYAQSKLANLLFTYELDRRLRAAGLPMTSVACHPGYAATNLQFVGPRLEGSTVAEAVQAWSNRLLAQDAAQGALPTLYAATASDVKGGDYIGPSGFLEARGLPRKVTSNAKSLDPVRAARLFEVSEALTGVRFERLRKAA
jgi:NAD(P)-dependent dehydrogenase (short-subunit alcohol dehydrogenase family)